MRSSTHLQESKSTPAPDGKEDQVFLFAGKNVKAFSRGGEASSRHQTGIKPRIEKGEEDEL